MVGVFMDAAFIVEGAGTGAVAQRAERVLVVEQRVLEPLINCRLTRC